MDKNKLIEIETTLAHQEQHITELNEVITDQWKEINVLKSAMAKLMRKLERMEHDSQPEEGAALSPIDRARQDIPPHY